MSIQREIEHKLNESLQPLVLNVENESDQHAGPATESHFKVTLVSDAFDGLTPVKRHQKVYRLLNEEMQGPVHALALHLYSPGEWQSRGGEVPESPACRGGDGSPKTEGRSL